MNQITMTFCICIDSMAVGACAQFCGDQNDIFILSHSKYPSLDLKEGGIFLETGP